MRIRKHFSTSNVIAVIALIMAFTSASYAAGLARNSVGDKQIKTGAVRSAEVRNNTQMPADTTYLRTVNKRVTASNQSAHPTLALARASAPKITLYTNRSLTIHAKCFIHGGSTYAEQLASSTAAGSVMDSTIDILAGGSATSDYLSPSTPEADREMNSTSAGTNGSSWSGADHIDASFATAAGGRYYAVIASGAKNGILPGGNGPWGAGNTCIFSGFAMKVA